MNAMFTIDVLQKNVRSQCSYLITVKINCYVLKVQIGYYQPQIDTRGRTLLYDCLGGGVLPLVIATLLIFAFHELSDTSKHVILQSQGRISVPLFVGRQCRLYIYCNYIDRVRGGGFSKGVIHNNIFC